MKTLDNSLALVFGVDTISAGIAKRFAREGAHVALLGENLEMARAVSDSIVAAGGKAFAGSWQRDGSVASAVTAALEQLGGLHILVTNVLPAPAIATLEEQTTEHFAQAFGCVQMAVSAMQAALPFLKTCDRGRIINVGHRYGEAVNGNIGAYNAAAWSLLGVTRTAAIDWGQYNIASNMLLPLADTPEFRQCHERRPKIVDMMVKQLPAQRVGDPEEDVGGAALYLAGDAVNYINGEILYADGGQHVAGAALDIGRFG